jgi:4-hydroxybenzoate polyprenyltransferase
MRPQQWTKNLFVFAGVVFARKVREPGPLLASLAAFALFCLLSSAVYLVNDIVDAEQDRQHPTKRNRPIASGRLSASAAGVAAILMAVAGLALSFALAVPFGIVGAIYLGLNLLYSFVLKHMVILDVLSVAIFFVLRAIAGAAAVNVVISHWLLICTILLALFIALSKRRHELVLLEENAASHRAILTEYTPYLLDQMIAVATASTLMAYVLYTVDARTLKQFGLQPELYAEHGSTMSVFQSYPLLYTIPCVIFGIFRYLYLVHQKGEGGNPDRIIISDRPFLINLLLWMGIVALAVYLR